MRDDEEKEADNHASWRATRIVNIKHEDNGVVVISPEHALLECYRYVVEEEGVWIAVRGGRVWACASDVCSKQENAWLDKGYDKRRIIDARKKSISVPRDALDRIVKIAGLP